MPRRTVGVTDYLFPSTDDEARMFREMDTELVIGQCKGEDDVIALCRNADAILNTYARMTPRVIESLEHCKVIVRFGIGYDNVDVAAATRCGVMDRRHVGDGFRRAIKNVDELEAMRIVAAICDACHTAISHFLVASMQEHQITAFAMEFLYNIPGIEDVEDIIVSSGPNSWPNWRHFSDRIIQPGDLVIIDMAAVTWNDYKSCMYRTYCGGKKPTVIDYLCGREDVDARRIAILGRSFGGYWSAKMSFVEPERLRAAVVWGGGVHYNFQPDWVRHSTNAESYLMDHEICRASAFGLRNLDELAAFFPSLSLKTQGLLDKPSCPTLVVNGKNDLQTPIEDLYLLLEHGGPKTARVFPGGHMGQTPETLPTIVRWLRKELDG